MSRRLFAFVAGVAIALMVSGRFLVERELARATARAVEVTRDERDRFLPASSLAEMKKKILRYKSKEILYTSGTGVAAFKGGFIPPRGPNGGLLHIIGFHVFATLNATVGSLLLRGEDTKRFCRTIDLKTVGGVKRFDNITGDANRLIMFTQLPPGAADERASIAIAAAANYDFHAYIPLSRHWAFSPHDTSLPSDFFDELRIGMASSADMSLSTSVVTVNAGGSYYIVAECFETYSVVLPAQHCWRQLDATSTSQVDFEIQTGGRLQDAYLYVPGVQGGQTLANLSELGIQGIIDEKLLTKDMRYAYMSDRWNAPSSFSTLGDPTSTDPFVANEAGTLRAVAIKLCTGDKVTDGREATVETLKAKLSAALPGNARIVYGFTVPVSEAQRAILERNHPRIRGWKAKTADKTRYGANLWPADMMKYLPQKAVF